MTSGRAATVLITALTWSGLTASAQPLGPTAAANSGPAADLVAEEATAPEEGVLDRRNRRALPLPDGAVGRRGQVRPRITNGKESSYSDVLGIEFRAADGTPKICSGILIGPRHLLTAGHCGCGRAGTYRATASMRMAGAKPTWIGVEHVHIFPGYRCFDSKPPGTDLAMIILKNAPKGPDHRLRHLITDPMASPRSWPTRLLAIGFGNTQAATNGVRMQAEIPVVSRDCARARFGELGCTPFVEMILADYVAANGAAARDTCGGDSGGPALARFSAREEYRLVAITSRALPIAQPFRELACGGGGIYTVLGRVTVANWLDGFGISRSMPSAPP